MNPPVDFYPTTGLCVHLLRLFRVYTLITCPYAVY
jgi:hypothetical protein